MRQLNSNSTFHFLVLYCTLCCIAPIFLFLGAIILHKSRISYILFILFAFYFGWHYEPQLDLLTHYNQFLVISKLPLGDMWTHSSTKAIGSEIFPVLFKYICSQISLSANLFSALACSLYASFFCLLLYTIRDRYTRNLSTLGIVLFLGILFTVEYVWFLGLRYWSGVFIFLFGYLTYTQKKDPRYLYFCLLAVCFHFAHVILLVTAGITHTLKGKNKLLFSIFCISLFMRFIGVDIIYSVIQLDFFSLIVKSGHQDISRMHKIAHAMAEYRAEANLYYLLRNEIVSIGVIFTYYLIHKTSSDISQYQKELKAYIIILFSIANIGYIDITFFDRICKVAVLMSFIYLFLFTTERNSSKISSRKDKILCLFLLPFVIYEITTTIVAQRAYLGNLALWFSSPL